MGMRKIHSMAVVLGAAAPLLVALGGCGLDLTPGDGSGGGGGAGDAGSDGQDGAGDSGDSSLLGRAAPRFTAPDSDGVEVSLDALIQQGPVVLVFHAGCT